LTNVAANSPLTLLGGLPTSALAEVARLVPGFAVHAGDLTPLNRGDVDGDRFRLFEAIGAVLDSLGNTAPVVVVIDDLHWADASTLALLRHLLRRPCSTCFVGTYRETVLGRTHPLSAVLGELRRETSVARVGLSGLAEAAVEALTSAVTGLELDADGRALARAVHRATDGVPFFVQETLRHLHEAGLLSVEAGWPPASKLDTLGIPEGVREVIGRRLSRLTDEANQTLALASVVGVEFVFDVVARIANTSEDQLVDALEEAHRAQLVVEVPGAIDHWRFAHPLVRETVYDELSASRRVRLHRRIAETVAAIAGADDERWLPVLAYHFGEAGETVDAAKAADYARRAAEHALGALAYEDAVRFAEMGLETLVMSDLVDDGERAGLLVVRGAALVRTGDPALAMASYEDAAGAARSAGAAELLARAAVGYDDAKFWDGRFQMDPSLGQRSAQLLAEARAALGEHDGALLVQVLSALAEQAGTEDETEASVALADAAVAAAERLGDAWLEARALKARSLSWWGPDGQPRDRLVAANRLIELAELTRDRELVYWGHTVRMMALVEGGELERAEAAIDDIAHLAHELHMEAVNADVELARGAFHLMRGHLADAERLAGEALAHYEGARYAGGPGLAGLQLLEACDAQGRLAEFEPWIEQMSESYGHRAGEELMQAGIRLRLGHVERAGVLYEPYAHRGFIDIPRGFSWMWTMESAVEVCATLEDRAGASTLLQLMSPCADRWISMGPMAICNGKVSRLLAMLETVLGRYDDAEAHYRDAIEAHAVIGAHLLVARTQLPYARMLSARAEPGDRANAAALLESAAKAAAELGLKRIASDADSLRQDLP
jgi:hypothetical protein